MQKYPSKATMRETLLEYTMGPFEDNPRDAIEYVRQEMKKEYKKMTQKELQEEYREYLEGF